MSRSAWVALLLVAAVIAGLIGSLSLLLATPGAPPLDDLAFSGGVAFFTFVGALIVWRQPGNRIGRLFAAIGLLWVTGDLAARYSTYAHTVGGGNDLLIFLGAWYGEWYWFGFLMLTFSLLPQLFPTGRPLGPRWAGFARSVWLFTGVVVLLAMLEDELILVGTDSVVRNPFGIPGFNDVEEGPISFGLLVGGLTSIVTAAVAIVLRFRRSRGEERQQLKWFTVAVLILVIQFAAQSALSGEDGHVFPLLDGVALALVPLSAAIAILRYRLYDFDVVVNKTLVYGSLSAILAGAYLGSVVLLQQVLGPVTVDSDVAVAGSTLAVAALFRPLRGRVQGFIDRRFYRHRYDAQQTLESFSFRLRNDVDLDNLTAELVDVVHETVRPAHASLWLRAPSGGAA